MISPWMFAWLAREREFELRRELERLRCQKDSKEVCKEPRIRGTILMTLAGWFRQRAERIPADKLGC
ncbi:MAG TPA: hypothetical protein DEQ80_03815 [Anaerolinea thermolimosa]|uniref:Uncharacterized protein n=1 Tax=Anaerolinea thermolimosa TaxID=229919 RepID=A0A3D1JH72_9CHLR|nr:hypothetical protein [Anaerolinea thermolimosa]GAP08384.1 hypothetical protein ATHL_03286 [Anaerolinea thermolimosa]HCE16966.1 hypothetical protein [Anaerolinea thermolimosa]